MPPHDDLARIKEALGPRVPDKHASYLERVRNETLAALARLETELARLEASNSALNRQWVAAGLKLDAAEAEVTRLRIEVARHAAQIASMGANERRLREGLREIVNTLGPDTFAGELEGLVAEGNEALRIARALLDRAVEEAVGPAPTEPGASHTSESSATARSLLADNQEASEPGHGGATANPRACCANHDNQEASE